MTGRLCQQRGRNCRARQHQKCLSEIWAFTSFWLGLFNEQAICSLLKQGQAGLVWTAIISHHIHRKGIKKFKACVVKLYRVPNLVGLLYAHVYFRFVYIYLYIIFRNCSSSFKSDSGECSYVFSGHLSQITCASKTHNHSLMQLEQLDVLWQSGLSISFLII